VTDRFGGQLYEFDDGVGTEFFFSGTDGRTRLSRLHCMEEEEHCQGKGGKEGQEDRIGQSGDQVIDSSST